MKIKENVKKIIPITKLDDLYVVADFDRTITTGSSKTSWSVLSSSSFVSESYKTDRQKLYEEYRPIEVDESLPLEYRLKMMTEWWKKHIELFIKYKLKEEDFFNAATNLRALEFRNGAKEFINFLYQNNIPLIIISAGIGNFIETFLHNNKCFYDNIYVSSNKIIFKDGIAFGVEDNIIHSLNKSEVSLPIDIKMKVDNRSTVLLLGDQLSDLNMVDSHNKNVVSVGFSTLDNDPSLLQTGYDIVVEDKEDYNTLKRILFK